MFRGQTYPGVARHSALNLAAAAVWQTPGRFAITRLLGPSYSLRCLVFHNVSATDSPFTRGMDVSIAPNHFEATLKFVVKHYHPVSLQDVLDERGGRRLPPRAVLVTFDDGYASVMDSAAALCSHLKVPAVFFLNAAFVDNHDLAPDNLVCYAASVLGMAKVNEAARCVRNNDVPKLQSLADVFGRFFPAITIPERRRFLDALSDLGGFDGRQLAMQARLYLTSKQIRELASRGFEIGSHTYTHVRCRSLLQQNLALEIDRNKTVLKSLSGREVRSFSVPYGSSADLTRDLAAHLQRSGHKAVFLSESLANPRGADPLRLDRISPATHRDDALFCEMEVLPRLRVIRNRLLGSRN